MTIMVLATMALAALTTSGGDNDTPVYNTSSQSPLALGMSPVSVAVAPDPSGALSSSRM